MNGKVAQNAMTCMRFSCGLFQIIFCCCSEYRHFKSNVFTRISAAALIIFLCLKFGAYLRAVPIYKLSSQKSDLIVPFIAIIEWLFSVSFYLYEFFEQAPCRSAVLIEFFVPDVALVCQG